MSLTTFLFKPKYPIEIVKKILDIFLDEFLGWNDSGIESEIVPLEAHNGWYKLTAWADGGSCDVFSEQCYNDEEIAGEQLTKGMMVILVESGVTKMGKDIDCSDVYDPEGHYLIDVELSEVLRALSNEDSCVYSPYEDSLWMQDVATGYSKNISMIDTILSQSAQP
jgi:hypothetical protein